MAIGAMFLAVAGGYAIGCGSPSPSTSGTTTSTSGSATTAGQLAQAGQTLYASRCAKCHGDQGQGITGPVLIGTENTLDKYSTAQGLLDFIDVQMPLDAPGSLSKQDYVDVVSFLLVRNSWVSSDTALDASKLGSISLK